MSVSYVGGGPTQVHAAIVKTSVKLVKTKKNGVRVGMMKMTKRNFYAKAVTRIAPRVEGVKTRYKRKSKHREHYDA